MKTKYMLVFITSIAIALMIPNVINAVNQSAAEGCTVTTVDANGTLINEYKDVKPCPKVPDLTILWKELERQRR